MSFLDLILIALLVLSAIGGYRRGALLQGFGLGGVIIGISVGALAARYATRFSSDPLTRAAIVLGILLAGMAIGNVVGWLIGARVRKHVRAPGPARADAVGGAALSVGALLLAVWFLALNLLHGPFPVVSTEIQTSAIVRTIDEVFPAPPSLLTGLEKAADLLGLQNTFVGLPPLPAAPVTPPSDSEVAAATAKAQRATVEILADGCTAGYRNEGSGFAVARGYVVTNAHVVAGTDEQAVIDGTLRLHADVVLFDPSLDIAVLHVPDLAAAPLSLDDAEVDARRRRGDPRLPRRRADAGRPAPRCAGCSTRPVTTSTDTDTRRGGSTSCRPRCIPATAADPSCCRMGRSRASCSPARGSTSISRTRSSRRRSCRSSRRRAR